MDTLCALTGFSNSASLIKYAAYQPDRYVALSRALDWLDAVMSAQSGCSDVWWACRLWWYAVNGAVTWEINCPR